MSCESKLRFSLGIGVVKAEKPQTMRREENAPARKKQPSESHIEEEGLFLKVDFAMIEES